MYLREFGLSARPFSLVPDTDLMVWTAGMCRIRDNVRTAIAERVSLIVLTGPVGTGKTTFLFALIEEKIDPTTHIVFLRRTIFDADDLLRSVAVELPEAGPNSSAADRIAATARRYPLLVILDEAQGASPEGVMALCRLAEDCGHMTVLIAGQPELGLRLDGADYHGLSVPVAHRHILSPLTEEEAQAYIAGRLKRVGARGDLIDFGACAVISQAAGRIPRKINKVAEACLFMAAIEERDSVDAAFAKRVVATDLDPVTLALSPLQDDGPVRHPRPVKDRDSPIPPTSAPVVKEPEQDSQTDVESVKIPAPVSSDTTPPISNDATAPALMATPARRRRSWFAGTVAAFSGVGLALLIFSSAEIVLQPADAPRPERVVSNIQVDPSAPAEMARPGGLQSPAVLSAPGAPENTAFRTPVSAAVPPTRGGEPAPIGPAPILLRAVPEPATASEQDISRLYARALSADDPHRAAIDYARAAVLGHTRSAVYIGQAYETGDGVLFSPTMAARWYAMADGTDPATIAVEDEPIRVDPLRGIRMEDRIDLVWDGIAPSFDIELADDEGVALGGFRTTLTAASLSVDATSWRIRPAGGEVSDWMPIEPETP